MQSAEDLHLRGELRGHEEDVRGVITCPLGVITASRDKTVRVWKESQDKQFLLDKSLVGHKSYVAPLAYIPGELMSDLPHGGIVSGSRDNTLRVWNVQTAHTIQVLEGHEYQVTGVIVRPDGCIVSCALDKSIRVWKDGKCIETLKGHEGPVQCLLLLPNGDFLSGSNDATIKLWSKSKCVHTFPGHTDTVRGLALLNNIGVVSASHDQTLRVWTFQGDCLAELVGHTALVYNAACSDDGGLIASASEDNSVRTWRPDGHCLQTIEHPACVWDVAWLPCGDLVTACADYTARVFTVKPDLAASAEAVAGFVAAVEARKQPQQAQGQDASMTGQLPAGVKMEEASVLLQPGKKDGDTRIVKEGGAGVAYSWDASRGEWEKIGTVVGGPGGDTVAAGNQFHEGQQYDFVFDVDVADGVPPLKLPVNKGDNPYFAADKFIERNELPTSYREQIVEFILQKTDGAVSTSTPSYKADPFTGAGAYVPGAASNFPQPGTQQSYADPFTGAGGYVPETPMDIDTSSILQTSTSFSHIPQHDFELFGKALNAQAVLKKLWEFSQTLAESDTSQGLTLSQEQAGSGLDHLIARTNAAASSSSAGFTEVDYMLLDSLLQWPAQQLFPAYDIARLVALDAEGAQHLAMHAGTLTQDSSGVLGAALFRGTQEPQLPANQQTGLRLACNLCKQPPLHQWLQTHNAALMDRFAPCCSSTNKPVRSGFATFMLNLAVFFSTAAKSDTEGQAQALSGLSELLIATPPGETDTLCRALIAVGTISSINTESKQLAQDLNVRQIAKDIQQQPNLDAKLKAVSADVVSTLQ
ncbi:hypothetical protein WJX77_002586 [Trebouxia sp. C0004]